MKTALLALAVSLAPPLVAQDAEAPRELPPVEAPPAMESRLEGRFERDLKRLRNSNAERRAETEAEIVEYGRAAIPGLVDSLHTDHEGLGEGLVTCLTALVDLRDRELVASHATSRHVYARAFAARAGGELGLDVTLDPLADLLDDPSTLVRIEAALALTANGREAGLDELGRHFTQVEERALAALSGVHGAGDHGPLVTLLEIDPQREREQPEEAAAERRAAVRMLQAIGDVPAVRALGGALGDPHNLVQRDAIDALRAICEDAEPFSGRSIFEQLGEVQRLEKVAATWTPSDGEG